MDEFARYAAHNLQRYSVAHFGYMRLVVSAITILFSFSCGIVRPSHAEALQSPEPPKSSDHVCQATTAKELVLDCSYRAGTEAFVSSPHLRLIHASFSLEVKGENYMLSHCRLQTRTPFALQNEELHSLRSMIPTVIIFCDAPFLILIWVW